MDTARTRGRFGGPSSLPGRILAALVCTTLAAALTACDGDRAQRDARPAEGRVIDEPFADLYVVAGERGGGRLYALDLLSLELQPLAKRRDLRAIVSVCDRKPVVRAGGDRTLLILENDALVDAPAGLIDGDDCEASGVAGRTRGWRRLALAPNGERVLVAKGRRVAVSSVTEGTIEELGHTRLPLQSAIWPPR